MKFLALPLLLLVTSIATFAQTVTFTTKGGPCCQYVGYTVDSENGQPASGSVHIQTAYGYPVSAVILPFNPTAPGQFLNPIINILSTITTGNPTDATQTMTYAFNSSQNLYGYTWAGSFTVQLTCARFYRGMCAKHVPGIGSGTMTATPVPPPPPPAAVPSAK